MRTKIRPILPDGRGQRGGRSPTSPDAFSIGTGGRFPAHGSRSGNATLTAAIIISVTIVSARHPTRISKATGRSPERWFADWPLEGDGFEPQVPLKGRKW